jgi:hypothetical protein
VAVEAAAEADLQQTIKLTMAVELVEVSTLKAAVVEEAQLQKS